MTGAVCRQGPLWAAVLNVAGELYQAFFESRNAALEAANASGLCA